MRRAGYAALFFLVGIFMPILIWVALSFAIRDILLEWRQRRLPRGLVCRIDSDCPSGYVCVAGRCVPVRR